MKTSTKKTILGMVTLTSLFLACGEADSAVIQILWSGTWGFICYLSGKACTKYFTEEDWR